MPEDVKRIESPERSQELYAEAEQALEAGDREGASGKLLQAAEANSSDDGVRLTAAMMRFEDGAYGEAAMQALGLSRECGAQSRKGNQRGGPKQGGRHFPFSQSLGRWSNHHPLDGDDGGSGRSRSGHRFDSEGKDRDPSILGQQVKEGYTK